jgi:hypothetical protein
VAAVPGDDWTAVFRGEVGLAGDGFEPVSVRPGLLGAHGELFLAPFADPWAAWEEGAPAPEPALHESRERELGAALQAAVSGSGGGEAREPDADDRGLLGLGGLFGGERDAAAGPADDGGLLGAVTEPLLDPSHGDPTLVAGANDLLAPVADVSGSLVDPVLDPVAPVLEPLVDPLVDGLLGGGRSN